MSRIATTPAMLHSKIVGRQKSTPESVLAFPTTTLLASRILILSQVANAVAKWSRLCRSERAQSQSGGGLNSVSRVQTRRWRCDRWLGFDQIIHFVARPLHHVIAIVIPDLDAIMQTPGFQVKRCLRSFQLSRAEQARGRSRSPHNGA